MSNSNVNWYQLGYDDSLRNYCRDLTYFTKGDCDDYTRGWIDGMVVRKDKLSVKQCKTIPQVRLNQETKQDKRTEKKEDYNNSANSTINP